jgi:hypothetical protein
MACSCCGHWRIQRIVLNGVQQLRVTNRGFRVAYCRSVDEVVAALKRQGGPDLAQFHRC